MKATLVFSLMLLASALTAQFVHEGYPLPGVTQDDILDHKQYETAYNSQDTLTAFVSVGCCPMQEVFIFCANGTIGEYQMYVMTDRPDDLYEEILDLYSRFSPASLMPDVFTLDDGVTVCVVKSGNQVAIHHIY